MPSFVPRVLCPRRYRTWRQWQTQPDVSRCSPSPSAESTAICPKGGMSTTGDPPQLMGLLLWPLALTSLLAVALVASEPLSGVLLAPSEAAAGQPLGTSPVSHLPQAICPMVLRVHLAALVPTKEVYPAEGSVGEVITWLTYRPPPIAGRAPDGARAKGRCHSEVWSTPTVPLVGPPCTRLQMR